MGQSLATVIMRQFSQPGGLFKMPLLSSLRFILNHPLNRDARRAALIRWLRWQIGSRILPADVVWPFVNDAWLIVRPGMTGATGNLYAGLHEFEDMAFLLHYLRPDDLFVDVGANVGSYTVLAGGAIGAACLSIEPLPQAFATLRRNIALNDMGDRVHALNLGLARQPGVLHFTSQLDTVNHVLSDGETHANSVEVPVRTLDEVVGDAAPALLKMDVEGYETEVLAGAERTLANPALHALILELNGSGRRYGFDEDAIRQQLRDLGFTARSYRPFERTLTPPPAPKPPKVATPSSCATWTTSKPACAPRRFFGCLAGSYNLSTRPPNLLCVRH